MKQTGLALVRSDFRAPKRLANGDWSQRIRFGQERAKRITLSSSLSASEAAQRFVQLRELSEPLAKLPTADALKFLDHASRAPADTDVEAMIRMAQERAAEAAEKKTAPLTFRELAEQWTSGKLATRFPDYVKQKLSADTDASRLKHLYPTIGHVELTAFTLDHAEYAMSKLPKTARRPASRRHYGQLIRRVLELAVYPCRILKHNPLPRGFLPKLNEKLEKNWLRPSEDSALMACGEIPLLRRALYGFCAREGTRISEALRLRWQDLDLQKGVLTLQAATKTKTVRAWKLSPGVPEALMALRNGAADDARVFPLSYSRKDAARFRADLKLAGVKRPELFKTTEARLRIRIHDTRTTFVTLALANGRSETWVQDRTGHRSSQQINGYRQGARLAGELNLGELERLDVALGIEEKPRHDPGHAPKDDETPSEETSTKSDECAREGSNLHALRRWNLNTQPGAATCTIQQENSGEPEADAAPSDIMKHDGPGSGAPSELDQALAFALTAAASAGQWVIVEQLARELEARRCGHDVAPGTRFHGGRDEGPRDTRGSATCSAGSAHGNEDNGGT